MRCDIIIPVWNQMAFTRDCVDSVFRNTEEVDYTIVIIDNASDKETRLYLEGLQASESARVLLIRNETNLGFVKAANQGIGLSKAPYICLLNNDTLVMKGWLKYMIEAAQSAGDIGVVNPSSNNLGQRPLRGEPLEHYADKLRQDEAGKIAEMGAAIGFCMLIKRDLIARIGMFDEIYGMGNFEDTDFSRRAVREGYRCVRACGAYVYHRENSSFNRLKTYDEDFKRNREIYEFRWGRTRRIAYILESPDANILRRIEMDSLKLAREGNWVWFFSKERLKMPEHSNIIPVVFPNGSFYLKTIFSILKKKKRFDAIFVGEAGCGALLEWISFIHKAKVGYY